MQLPPQNIEIEESVLSASILFEESRYYYLGRLRPKHFYRTAHQHIWSAITSLAIRSEPVDANTLLEVLRRQNRLEVVGGPVYLSKFLGDVPIPADDSFYADTLLQKAAMRELIVASNEITAMAFSSNGDGEQVLAKAYAKILAVDIGIEKQELRPLSELLDPAMEYLEMVDKKGAEGGLLTSFASLDKLTGGLHGGEVTILAGRPSMGKTAFALNLARNMARAEIASAFFSLEMAKLQMVVRLLGLEGDIPSERFRSGCIKQEEWLKISNAASRLHNYPIWVDDTPKMHYGELVRKIHRAVRREGVKFVVIDYMGFLIGDEPRNRVQDIGQVSRAIKACAKDLDVPIIVLAQLNRSCEMRTDRRPRLSDLRDSGDLEQDADNVLLLYRDAVYNRDPNNPERHIAELILAKQRNGPVGTAKMIFFENRMEFGDMVSENVCEY